MKNTDNSIRKMYMIVTETEVYTEYLLSSIISEKLRANLTGFSHHIRLLSYEIRTANTHRPQLFTELSTLHKIKLRIAVMGSYAFSEKQTDYVCRICNRLNALLSRANALPASRQILFAKQRYLDLITEYTAQLCNFS